VIKMFTLFFFPPNGYLNPNYQVILSLVW